LSARDLPMPVVGGGGVVEGGWLVRERGTEARERAKGRRRRFSPPPQLTTARAGDERPLGAVAALEVLRAPDQRAARQLQGEVQAERQREHARPGERQRGRDRGQHHLLGGVGFLGGEGGSSLSLSVRARADRKGDERRDDGPKFEGRLGTRACGSAVVDRRP
jgi:hypothetical protein